MFYLIRVKKLLLCLNQVNIYICVYNRRNCMRFKIKYDLSFISARYIIKYAMHRGYEKHNNAKLILHLTVVFNCCNYILYYYWLHKILTSISWDLTLNSRNYEIRINTSLCHYNYCQLLTIVKYNLISIFILIWISITRDIIKNWFFCLQNLMYILQLISPRLRSNQESSFNEYL